MLDVRPVLKMREVCEVLLHIAEKPLDYLNCLNKYGWNSDAAQCMASDNAINAAFLARQASASVVLNCAAEMWSTAVWCLMTLEPIFPCSEDIPEFVKECRMPWIAYVSTVYKLCNQPFKGTRSQQVTKIILGLRDEIIHDKPAPFYTGIAEYKKAIVSWQKKLEPLVGSESLRWLPYVGNSGGNAPGIVIMGEPVVMKFMKYSVAQWVLDSTVGICQEMVDMVLRQPVAKKIKRPPDGELLLDMGKGVDPGLWFAGEYEDAPPDADSVPVPLGLQDMYPGACPALFYTQAQVDAIAPSRPSENKD